MRTITRIPQPGDTSKNVEVLQEALNEKGYGLKVDGQFGPKTRAAVSNFQKSVGLAGSGVPGPNTITNLGIQVLSDSGATEPEPSPDLNPYPVGTFTREVVADKIVSIMQHDVDNKLRETNGKNRSPRIDTFNRRVGVPMGTPYCASGGWCAIDDACKALGLKNPVPKTAASQDFRRSSFVPAKYIRENGTLGKKGDVGVLQVAGDAAHGHHTVLKEDQKSQPKFKTVEYNTDAVWGDRDGDGAYNQERSTIDRSIANSMKIFVCFTDIPQWIIDYNLKGKQS